MKKILVLVTICFMFVLTACGSNKTLICVSEVEEQDGMNVSMEYRVDFESDKATAMKATLNFEVTSEDLKEEFDDFVGLMDSFYGEDLPGIEITSTTEGYTYKLILEIDLKDVTEESLEEMDFDLTVEDLNMTINEIKEDIETEDGITCTIK